MTKSKSNEKQYKQKFLKCILCGKPVDEAFYKFCSPECKAVYRRKYRQLWFQNHRERVRKKRLKARHLAKKQQKN